MGFIVDVAARVGGDEVSEPLHKVFEVFFGVVSPFVVATHQSDVGEDGELFRAAHEIAAIGIEDSLGFFTEFGGIVEVLQCFVSRKEKLREFVALGEAGPPVDSWRQAIHLIAKGVDAGEKMLEAFSISRVGGFNIVSELFKAIRDGDKLAIGQANSVIAIRVIGVESDIFFKA